MARIDRSAYVEAASRLLQAAGFRVRTEKGGRLLGTKADRLVLVDVAGKNLPYTGKNGKGCFAWETWLQPSRLTRLENDASVHSAEPWIGYCYVILDEAYKAALVPTVKVGSREFGLRLITPKSFRAAMTPRSPSWGEMNLPRDQVLTLTCGAHAI